MKPTTVNASVDLSDIFRLSHHEITDDVLKMVDEQFRIRTDITGENCLEIFIQETTKAYEDQLREPINKRNEKSISQQVEQQR